MFVLHPGHAFRCQLCLAKCCQVSGPFTFLVFLLPLGPFIHAQMCSNLMMGWWRPINVHLLFFFSSPLPMPGKYLQFYPNSSGSRQRINFVVQEKSSELVLSVICNSGIFKTSLYLCLSLSWQGNFIFLTETCRISFIHLSLDAV